MRKFLLLTIITAAILSCKNSNKKVEDKETTKVETVDNTEKYEQLFAEFNSLYQELLDFKDADDFKQYGFGDGGPYYKWLKKVEELKNNPDSKLLVQKGLLIGELEQLGLVYVSSKGKETEVTKYFNKVFSDANSVNPDEKVETKSGNGNYDKIKADYELFGKWKINNSLSKQNYPYEIYKKGNEYIGVIPQGDYKTEILEKNGNTYLVKGNEYGEYYQIDANLNMILFDKDGDLTKMGYIAIKD